MPRPRTPLAKAESTGRTLVNPGRFKKRKEAQSRPLGAPSEHLSETARTCWESFKREIPWLMERDRAMVETASMARAVLIDEGFDVKVAAQLRMFLSAMGASPADATKVHAPSEKDEDPADAFLQ